MGPIALHAPPLLLLMSARRICLLLMYIPAAYVSWQVLDSMLQDSRRYPQWAVCIKGCWAEHRVSSHPTP